MESYKKNLGKVCITPEGFWDIEKEYERISIVTNKNDNSSYISKKDVPRGISLDNEEYWQPIGVAVKQSDDDVEHINLIPGKGIAIDNNTISIKIGTGLKFDDKDLVTIIDNEFSLTSENPVQNKILTAFINKVNEELWPTPKPILSVTRLPGDNDFDHVGSNTTSFYQLGKSYNITVSWRFTLSGNAITPDNIYINNEEINIQNSTNVTNKTYTNVVKTTDYNIKVTKDDVNYTGKATATFIYPKYYGANNFNVINETNIKTLNVILANTKEYLAQKEIILNQQKIYYAYPSNYGVLTSIWDMNNFNSIDGFEKTDINITIGANIVPYYVYSMKVAGNNPAKFGFNKKF